MSKEVALLPKYLVAPTTKVYGEVTLANIQDAQIMQSDKDIILACFREKKIREIEANHAGKGLTAIINLTLFEGGMAAENIPELVQIVIKDIFRDYSSLTLSEVALAFRRGVREEYGELKGVNVRQFYVWLRSYIAKTKKDAFEQLKKVKPIEKEITQDQKDKLHKEWLLGWANEYDSWAKKGVFTGIDVGGMFYKWIIKNKLLELSSEDKKEVIAKARIALQAEHSLHTAKDANQRKEFKDILDKLTQKDKSVETQVQSKAKIFAIVKYFNKIKAEQTTLRKILYVTQ